MVEEGADPAPAAVAPRKAKFDRSGKTGREPGFTTIFFNVGRKHLVTPADIVGKVAGLPIHQLLGSSRDRVPMYVSSMFLGSADDYGRQAAEAPVH